ncbi:DUF2264 domain-containing protein, partial [Rhizobium johnstonii]
EPFEIGCCPVEMGAAAIEGDAGIALLETGKQRIEERKQGAAHIGADFDRSLTRKYLEELEGFYIGEGWYRDGNVRRIDHYIPFA